MKIIAHRAGTDRFPEQSMASIRHSFAMGADYVEVDVRFTKDGVPVICHDANVGRVFGLDAEVSSLSLAAFLSLRHRADPAMGTYTLEQLFEANPAPLLLHYKSYVKEQLTQVLKLIRLYGMQERAMLGVEAIAAVEQVKAFDPGIRVLAFMPTVFDLDAFLGTDADVIRLWENWVKQEYVERIHGTRKECWIMAGAHESVGYTDIRNLETWGKMGIDGVLLNEIEPLNIRK